MSAFVLIPGRGLTSNSTDFRQFEQYLNVTGLDVRMISCLTDQATSNEVLWQMAVIGNSYLYHMRKVRYHLLNEY